MVAPKRCGLAAFALACAVSAVSGQTDNIDFNDYYKYSLSFGGEYQSLSSLAEWGTSARAIDFAGTVRYPLPSNPIIQPFGRLGLINVAFSADSGDTHFNHSHIYGLVGAGYVNRFSKSLEIGGEAGLGFTEAMFADLDPDPAEDRVEPARSGNLLFSLGAKVSLIPSFNMSLSVRPNVSYLLSVSPLKRFNGLLFGLGISGSYRFGDDPDSSSSIIRSIRFSAPQVDPLFSALRGFYAKSPIGSVTITNVEKDAISDVVISFSQKAFMDDPTPLITIPVLEAGSTMDIPIFANFNEDVFKLIGKSTLTGEIKAVYSSRNKIAEQSQPVSFDLYDKTSLIWDDDRKVAAYITPADSALVNYSSRIRQYANNELNPGLSESLQTGMMIYGALTEFGCIYQLDPRSPFDAAQSDPLVVDTVKLPRTTLGDDGGAGDCDDLTVLYNSLLEAVGIQTAFITTPGHIYSAFNTGVSAKDFRTVHPDKSMTLIDRGAVWIPVEITMLGTGTFLEAWRRGAEEWVAYKDQIEKRALFFTAEAQAEYGPVSLREKDLGLQYGDRETIVDLFKDSRDGLVNELLENAAKTARESNRKNEYNKLGIAAAQLGDYARSESAFKTALSIDRDYLSPKVNLGNVYMLQDQFRDAIQVFYSAESDLINTHRSDSPHRYRILLNISRAYYELENYDKAKEIYLKVAEASPEIAAEYSYIGEAGDDSRASAAPSRIPLIYIEEEE